MSLKKKNINERNKKNKKLGKDLQGKSRREQGALLKCFVRNNAGKGGKRAVEARRGRAQK